MIEHETFTWFAAIDWGTEKHQACVVDVRGGIAGERAFSHDGAGLALLCDWILSIVGNATIVAVAVEVPHGPVVVPAYCLPVYASQSPLPDATQDSVRGCRLGFTAVALSGDMVSCAFKAQPAQIRTSPIRASAPTLGV